ncbi:MAG TPA: response regulator [bacterium]|nr:response regulator [bacterium]HOL46960.1 response regulator [bacterium]HPQ18225.1 response regulator [bacterium]
MADEKIVLLVDDDDELVEVMTTILEVENYKVYRAENGRQAFELLQNIKPNLIVMDVMMETINDGIETAQKLKADDKFNKIPIIMLTNVNKELPLNISSDESFLPVELFLEKPLVPTTFLVNVKKLII